MTDPELRARLRPDFTPGCKRILASNEWYAALQRDDVTVIDGGVTAVEGRTIVGADGSRTEVETWRMILPNGWGKPGEAIVAGIIDGKPVGPVPTQATPCEP